MELKASLDTTTSSPPVDRGTTGTPEREVVGHSDGRVQDKGHENANDISSLQLHRFVSNILALTQVSYHQKQDSIQHAEALSTQLSKSEVPLTVEIPADIVKVFMAQKKSRPLGPSPPPSSPDFQVPVGTRHGRSSLNKKR
ncbi:hypothetical protein MUG91_G10n93 [Manis pentadactyla]|nr:hypothetical protein MUG91_G10n93 [Manis pentadactyla]